MRARWVVVGVTIKLYALCSYCTCESVGVHVYLYRQSESVILISVNLLFLLSFYKGATEPISLHTYLFALSPTNSAALWIRSQCSYIYIPVKCISICLCKIYRNAIYTFVVVFTLQIHCAFHYVGTIKSIYISDDTFR